MKLVALTCLGLLAFVMMASGTFAQNDLPPQNDPVNPGNLTDADVGNWTFGDCLMVQFAMEFTVRPDKSDSNVTIPIRVDPFAKVDPDRCNCGEGDQNIKMYWTLKATNDTVMLMNNLTLTFSRSNTT